MFNRVWFLAVLLVVGVCLTSVALANDAGPTSTPAVAVASSAAGTPTVAPPPHPSAFSSIVDEGIKLVAAILLVLATWGAQRLIRLFVAKAKIDIPAKQEEQIDAWVRQGIAYAESKSSAKLKELTVAMRGPEKLEAALAYVIGAMATSGAFDYGRDLLVRKIEALLHQGKHPDVI
jgi:hypothetical protein